ncbi:MAG: polyprenyl synthetase family protein [Deltaproteobacteria bacterium]|nr:polyprenyl synthetase family protein [Deltaproteobacteria bacterium]
MRIQDVFRYYGEDIRRVEDCMKRHLSTDVDLIVKIVDHLVGSGGKRFRPLLLLATSDLCGYRGERRYPMSAMIELIHTATLLHDDVVDHAETRRGKASANNIWGNSASVLVGDFLVSKSFKLMTDDGSLAVMKLMCTTTNTMAEGELFQLSRSGDIGIGEREYLSLIEKKTSILIAAACAIGAILADAPATQVEALTRFGMRIGSAFQITDDTLDYVAKEEEFGKVIGKDLEEGKITLPLIHALKRCSREEKELVKRFLGTSAQQDQATGGIMALISRYGGIAYALEKARSFIEEGKGILGDFEDSDAKAALIAISDYIIERRI